MDPTYYKPPQDFLTSPHKIQESKTYSEDCIDGVPMVSQVVSEKKEDRVIEGRKVEFIISECPLELKEAFFEKFNYALKHFYYLDILNKVIMKYAMELETYPDLLLDCFSEFEHCQSMCERRGKPGLNPCYATQGAAFIGRVIQLISKERGAEFIDTEHFFSVREYIATMLRPALPMMVGNPFFLEEIRLAETCGLDASCVSPMNRVGNLSEMPINFIWFGGVLPDRYISNVQKWADLYTNQKIIMWFDKRLLNSDEHSAMIFLEEIIPNLLVLDIGDAGFDDLDDSYLNEHFKTLLDKILLYPNKGSMQEGRYYVTASDLLRYALMIKQGSAINTALKARGRHVGNFGCGMIYFDTDIFASNVRGFLPDSPMEHGVLHSTLSWKRGSADIDVLAANSCGIELFKATLYSSVSAHRNSSFAQNKSIVPDWTLSATEQKDIQIHQMLLSDTKPTVEFASKLHFPFFNFSNDGDRSWGGGRYKISERTLIKRYKKTSKQY